MSKEPPKRLKYPVDAKKETILSLLKILEVFSSNKTFLISSPYPQEHNKIMDSPLQILVSLNGQF